LVRQAGYYCAATIVLYGVVVLSACITRFLTMREFHLLTEEKEDIITISLARHGIIALLIGAILAGVCTFLRNGDHGGRNMEG
jgi:hypothetical protein